MEMRKINKLGVETSLLGFGCMRLPKNADGTINEPEAERMIDYAIANGVNYIDTAWPYHEGNSEIVVGKVLKKYDRDSFYLATKLPVWDVKCVADAERIFNKQLEKLQTDHIDFYLLHALDEAKFDALVEQGIIEFCEELKAQGKIRFLGFSFHDSYEAFEKIITYRDWDFCQIQYNYMDRHDQAGDRGYELAKKLDVPFVIMEPIKGGNLANFSEDINAKFAEMNPEASIASYALRWVGSHDNVKVILSGMTTFEQVEDNLKTFADFKCLTEEEEQKIDEIAEILHSRVKNGCTGCRYCMPCPAGVNIPGNFAAWNKYHIFGTYSHVAWDWEHNLKESEKPQNCIKCGKCEKACPQHLSIRDNLVQVKKDFDERIYK